MTREPAPIAHQPCFIETKLDHVFANWVLKGDAPGEPLALPTALDAQPVQTHLAIHVSGVDWRCIDFLDSAGAVLPVRPVRGAFSYYVLPEGCSHVTPQLARGTPHVCMVAMRATAVKLPPRTGHAIPAPVPSQPVTA